MLLRYNLTILVLLVFGGISAITAPIDSEIDEQIRNNADTDHTLSVPEIIIPLQGNTIGGLVRINWKPANEK